MTGKNKRAELELRLSRYRELARQVFDPKTTRRIEGLILELEQELREIDDRNII
jgi:hypothetical protein